MAPFNEGLQGCRFLWQVQDPSVDNIAWLLGEAGEASLPRKSYIFDNFLEGVKTPKSQVMYKEKAGSPLQEKSRISHGAHL